jgi:hypothetical protein
VRSVNITKLIINVQQGDYYSLRASNVARPDSNTVVAGLHTMALKKPIKKKKERKKEEEEKKNS